MQTTTKIRCVVVTPEKTVVEKEAAMVVVPAFDGEVAFLAGHAPTVARLGSGELRLLAPHEKTCYFVEGGFAQVRDNVVTVLTSRVRFIKDLNVAELESELAQVSRETTPVVDSEKARSEQMDRLRAALRVAKRSNNNH